MSFESFLIITFFSFHFQAENKQSAEGPKCLYDGEYAITTTISIAHTCCDMLDNRAHWTPLNNVNLFLNGMKVSPQAQHRTESILNSEQLVQISSLNRWIHGSERVFRFHWFIRIFSHLMNKLLLFMRIVHNQLNFYVLSSSSSLSFVSMLQHRKLFAKALLLTVKQLKKDTIIIIIEG